SSSWSSICSQSPHSPHHSHFFFPRYSALRYLHSFPTRRSSDLGRRLLSMPELHDPIPTREKVLIIGAGPAGLAAAAALKALEVPFDLVDRAKDVGGIWNTEREDSPVWPTMEMISSRGQTQYEDLLQPASFPDFLAPGQMAKYLRAYAARHGITEHFRPRTAVRAARPFEE